uniref:Uncharacterized protein n=1 Tax=Romanomermis culicivorax TaxID=13658 RepID=A0A915HVM6_ROMCU
MVLPPAAEQLDAATARKCCDDVGQFGENLHKLKKKRCNARFFSLNGIGGGSGTCGGGGRFVASWATPSVTITASCKAPPLSQMTTYLKDIHFFANFKTTLRLIYEHFQKIKIFRPKFDKKSILNLEILHKAQIWAKNSIFKSPPSTAFRSSSSVSYTEKTHCVKKHQLFNHVNLAIFALNVLLIFADRRRRTDDVESGVRELFSILPCSSINCAVPSADSLNNWANCSGSTFKIWATSSPAEILKFLALEQEFQLKNLPPTDILKEKRKKVSKKLKILISRKYSKQLGGIASSQRETT